MEENEYNRYLGLALLSPVLAVDTEGTSFESTDYRDGTGYGFGISISGRDSNNAIFSVYFPIRHTLGNVSESIREALSKIVENHPVVVFHNLKHDVVALETMGIKRDLLSLVLKTYDTMLMQHFINENIVNKGLDALGNLYFGRGKATDEVFKAALVAFGWHPNFPAHIMAIYAAMDAELTLLIFEKLYPYFKKQGFDG